MAAERISVEIGFDGGQVIPVKLTEAEVKDLRGVVSRGKSPHELETEEGLLVLDMDKVIFIRISSGAKTIGF